MPETGVVGVHVIAFNFLVVRLSLSRFCIPKLQLSADDARLVVAPVRIAHEVPRAVRLDFDKAVFCIGS